MDVRPRTKLLMAAVLVVLLTAVVVLIAVAASQAGSVSGGAYEACKERLRSDFEAGRTVERRPDECKGLGDDDLQRIVGEILGER